MTPVPTGGMPAGFDRRALVVGLSGLTAALAWPRAASADSRPAAKEAAPAYPVTYHRTTTVDGIKIFYREAGPKDASRRALNKLFTLETTKFQYTDGMSDISRIAPDNWVHDQALLDRPGNNEIQLDLFYDYRTNLPLYPAVQAYFRKHKPPTLIVWGKNDFIFPADGAHPYKRDLPDVEFHLIDTGHFALEDRFDDMVPLIRDFLRRKIA